MVWIMSEKLIVSKTRNAPGWATKADNLIPNGVKCNENVIWVSVLRLTTQLKIFTNGIEYIERKWHEHLNTCICLLQCFLH